MATPAALAPAHCGQRLSEGGGDQPAAAAERTAAEGSAGQAQVSAARWTRGL